MSEIIGLDLSTVSTGIVRISSGGKVLESLTIKPNLKAPTDLRVCEIVGKVITYITSYAANTEIVIIEDVYNIRRNTQCLLELRGAIKTRLIELGINFTLLAANKARYITNAIPKTTKQRAWTRDEKKAHVMRLVTKHFKVKFANNDESDAALLCLAYLKTRSTHGKAKVKNKSNPRNTRR